MFSPFEVCVVDKNTGRIYRKEDIDYLYSYENTIVLFELKNKIGDNEKFKIGDIFFNEEERKYYIFTLIKKKKDLEFTAMEGFGFFVFEKKNNLPSDSKLFYGTNFIKDKTLDYLCNIFVDNDYAMSIVDCDYMKQYEEYLLNLNNVQFYTKYKDKKINFYTLIKAKKDNDFFKREVMMNDLYFRIIYYQKILLESKNVIITDNGSLFTIREESKELFSNKDNLKKELLYSNNLVDSDIIPEKVLDNSLLFFDKFFLFLDDGVSKLISLNNSFDNDEVDYTSYFKITGNHFFIVQDEKLVIQNFLNLIGN